MASVHTRAPSSHAQLLWKQNMPLKFTREKGKGRVILLQSYFHNISPHHPFETRSRNGQIWWPVKDAGTDGDLFFKLVVRWNITIFHFRYFVILANARVLIDILINFPLSSYWQILSSQFSIFPTVWSVGDDRSPLQNLLNTMCNPPHKWMVAKLSFVLREIATEFISLKLYKETRRSIRWVFELKGDIWSCGGRGFGCKKYFGKKFVYMKS